VHENLDFVCSSATVLSSLLDSISFLCH